MLRDAILRAETLADRLSSEPEIELLALVMQTASFRYVPSDLDSSRTDPSVASYLDLLNHRLAADLDRASSLRIDERPLNGGLAIQLGVTDHPAMSWPLECIPPLVTCAGRRLDSTYRCRIEAEPQAGSESSSFSTRFAAAKSGRS